MSPPVTPAQVARSWRAREREWGSIALATVLACAVFSLWPSIDLAVSQAFVDAQGRFVGDAIPPVRALYLAVPWITRAAALVALVALCMAARRPAWMGRRWRRRAGVTLLVLVLGVGLVVNGVLKQGWGRARPVDVGLVGGAGQFAPALRKSDQCARNCSFVSGHAASGFALIAWGLLGAPARRRRWLLLGGAAGLLVGLGRIAQGGHFASDVVFSGLVMWICSAAVREAWLLARLRWPSARSSRRPSAG